MAVVCKYLRQNVLGLVAIFIALSGSAYAVTAAKNSVDSAAIQNGSVRGADLHAKSVSAKKLKLPSVVKVLQSRVTGTCAGTSILQSIAQNGTVGCTAIPSDAAAGTPSLRTLGTGANQAVANSDARLTNNRTPTDGSVTPAKLAALPGGRMTQTGTCQTVVNGGFPQLTFNALESWGPGHDVTFNNAADSLTVNTAGTYLVTAYVEWLANGTGDRALGWTAAGATKADGFDTRTGTGSTGTQGQSTNQLVHIPAGTVFTANVAQTIAGGGTLTLQDLGANCASFAVQWIGP